MTIPAMAGLKLVFQYNHFKLPLMTIPAMAGLKQFHNKNDILYRFMTIPAMARLKLILSSVLYISEIYDYTTNR